MEEVLVVLRNFEQENQILHEYVVHLQTNQASTSLGCISTTKPQQKKPWISLFDKFDGTCSKFRGFVNQLCIIIQLHPHQYLTSLTQVAFISILLSNIAFVWFAPLLEH